MDWLNAVFIALSMSVDAMTVSASDAIIEKNLTIKKMLFIAFIFGLFQFMMPLIGYGIGISFKDYIAPYIPWIAFSLLTLLGIKSIIDWIIEFRKRKKGEEINNDKKLTIWNILIQGVATSIDALCIGFVYLQYEFLDAFLGFLIIFIFTFVLSFTTAFLGQKVASKLEKWATLIAGIVFIAIGLKILLEGIL